MKKNILRYSFIANLHSLINKDIITLEITQELLAQVSVSLFQDTLFQSQIAIL